MIPGGRAILPLAPRRPAASAALALAAASVATAAGAYDGGRLSGAYAYGPGGRYPLSLPQTLRATVTVPLPAAPAEPADTLDTLYPALAACWRPPPALAGTSSTGMSGPGMSGVGTSGVEITARFALRRDGRLVGPPRITYTAGVAGDRRGALVEATLAALRACTPARITRGLGRAVAGRPVALRLIYRPPA